MSGLFTIDFSNIQTISLFEINLTASLLILAVMIFRGVLKNRNPKRFFASLWIIVLLRLIIPFSVPLMINLFPPDYYSVVDKLRGERQIMHYNNTDGTISYYGNVTETEATSIADTGFNLMLIALIFGIGAFLVFVFLHLRNRKEYAEALPLSDERINALIKSYGLKRNISVKYSDRISAPITYGVFKPIIILPKACLETDFEKLQCIISHEIAHIRYFDIVYKWIITAVTCLYWYNPFVWIMFVLSERDIETACDKEAIERCGCSKDDYSDLLISLEEKRCTDILARGFTAGAIKERIKSIMKAKKTGVFSCVLAVIMSVASFTVFTSAHTGTTAMSEIAPTIWSKGEEKPKPLLWLEPQRYYLEGGTEEEYIEVFDDGTIQCFGLDYMSKVKEIFGDEYSEADCQRIKDAFWMERKEYRLNGMMMSINSVDGNAMIIYDDENTLNFNGESGKYRAEKPWKAGVYRAEWVHYPPAYGYYYCDTDDTKIFIGSETIEYYDEDGRSTRIESFGLVMYDERPDDVIVATNYNRLKDAEPEGFLYFNDTNSIYEIESGKTYTLGSKPIFS